MIAPTIESCRSKSNTIIDLRHGISIIDIFIAIGYIWIYISNEFFANSVVPFATVNAVLEVKMLTINILLLVYVAIRVLQSLINNNYLVQFVLLMTLLFMVYELGNGVKQIVEEIIYSYHVSVNGSFSNSGPYGGFLALSLCSLYPSFIDYSYNKLARSFAISIACVCMVMILLSLSRSAWLSMGICFTTFALLNKKGKKNNILVVVVYFFIIGTCAYFIKKKSADGRVLMDKIAITSITRNSVWGAGLGRYCGAYGEASFDYFKTPCENEKRIECLPSISHERSRNIAGAPSDAFNEFLRAGVELGILGMLLLLIISVFSLYILFVVHSPTRYGLLSLLVFALFSYPFSLFSFQLYFVLFIAIASAYSRKTITGRSSSILGVVFLFVVGFKNFQSYPRFKIINACEKKWTEYDDLYDKGLYSAVNDNYYLIHNNLMHDTDFLLKYGKSLQKERRYEESSMVFSQCTKISSDPIFWNELGNNLSEEGLYDEAERCYLRAFYILPNRIYPLYYLSKMFYKKGDLKNFLLLVHVIEDFEPKINSNTVVVLREEIMMLSSKIELDVSQ